MILLDTRRRQLVEAHFFQDSPALHHRLDRALEVRSPLLVPVLDTGKWEGRACFTTPLVDGECLQDYVARRGPLPPATVFALVFPLLEELLRWQDEGGSVFGLRPDRVLMTTVEGAFLQLKVTGLGGVAGVGKPLENGLVTQACHLLFLMLAGKSCRESHPERVSILGSLPASLSMTLRSVMNGGEAVISLERLRDEVRGGMGLVSGGMQARMMKKQLIVIQAFQPRSRLQDLLGMDRSAGRLLKAWNCKEPVAGSPFVQAGQNPRDGNPLTGHLLPTECLGDSETGIAVASEIWRVQAERHPNILCCIALKEGRDWSLLAEEREPGFNLARLLAERGSLNPQETAVILRQVHSGLMQAEECGISRADLRPDNVFLQVGKEGPLMSREHERLMQKRLDVWPAFHVQLRLHPTLQSLLEPPLDGGAAWNLSSAESNHATRALASLAVWLISGQRPGKDKPVFPDAVPVALASFLATALESPRAGAAAALLPSAFLDRFEDLMVAPALLFRLTARPRKIVAASEELESAGSVSDFDEDWLEEPSEAVEAKARIFPRQGRRVHFGRRLLGKSTRWQVLAASMVVLASISGWWLFSKELPPHIPPVSATHQALSQPAARTPSAPATRTILAASRLVPSQSLPKSKTGRFDWEPLPPVQPVYARLLHREIQTPSPPKEGPPPPPLPHTIHVPAEFVGTVAFPPMPLPFFQDPPPVVRRALIPTPEEIARFKQASEEPPGELELYTAQPESPIYP